MSIQQREVTVEAAVFPVFGEYDVVVCGGGPAGIGAAITAAQNGCKTLLIEATACLGGLIGNGFLRGFCDSPGGPVFDDLAERLLDLGEARWGKNPQRYREPGRLGYHPEMARAVVMEMVHEAGAEVLLNTFVEGPFMSGETVEGVFIATKQGRQLVKAQTVIDCTADADIAAGAGAPFHYGDPEDGHIQLCSFRCEVGGIDHERFERDRPGDEELEALFADAVSRGEIMVLDGLAEHPPKSFPFDPESGLYIGRWDFKEVDATDPAQVSRALEQSQRAMLQIVRFCRKNLPGYEDMRIERFPDALGIRESRRIVGRYTLTKDDVLAGRKFDDGLVPAWFWCDLHEPQPHYFPFTTEYVHSNQPPPGDWYEIPYRSLLPQDVRGLLVAGRSISADRPAHGSLRIMPTCMFLGTAAARAATRATEEHTDVTALDGAALKAIMSEHFPE
ncbi:MAG: FAD-dependent oxidoreductase [Armatimonadota bacterium]